MTPMEYRSLRASSGSPLPCSGDMYSGVPTSVPLEVSGPFAMLVTCEPRSLVSLAIPKSHTFTTSAGRPSSSTPGRIMMFSGFRSRCTTPSPCANCSALSVCMRTPMIRSPGIGHSARITASRSLPARYSIAM
jgi:hypothetical protein